MKKNTKILIGLIFMLSAIIVFTNLKSTKEVKVEEQKTRTEVSPYLNSDIQVKTFQGEKGWGYDITIDGTTYVHQPSIPALSGDDGFKTEADAKNVANLMVEKIRKNIMPPGVTEEEVKAILAN